MWLRKQYLVRGRTAADIANEVRCSEGTVRRALRQHGIDRDGRAARPHARGSVTQGHIGRDWLIEQYVIRGRSQTDIARALGVGQPAVSKALGRYGLRERGPSAFWQLDDPDWLRARYVTEGLSQHAIAQQIGCHPATLREAFARHHIER